MSMNQIIRIVADYVGKGEKIKKIVMDTHKDPKGIVVVLKGDVEKKHKIRCKGKDEFMAVWKPAAKYLRHKLLKRHG